VANENTICYPSGQYVYLIIRETNGNVWYPTGTTFEDWGGGAGRDMDDYDTALIDETGSFYQNSLSDANFNAAAGKYVRQIFLRVGANPADGDPFLRGNDLYWDGSNEITEIEYALQVNTIAEMSASAPPASPTIEQILNYIYRLLRNKTNTTSSLITVRNDADDGDLYKATLSNNGTTFTKAEYVSG
jgi:hypothetical protein